MCSASTPLCWVDKAGFARLAGKMEDAFFPSSLPGSLPQDRKKLKYDVLPMISTGCLIRCPLMRNHAFFFAVFFTQTSRPLTEFTHFIRPPEHHRPPTNPLTNQPHFGLSRKRRSTRRSFLFSSAFFGGFFCRKDTSSLTPGFARIFKDFPARLFRLLGGKGGSFPTCFFFSESAHMLNRLLRRC